ncbi:MAG: hypothetical protein A3F84_24040 [Candidatus Handelsmanbacteria bacterium RIFCSPLOWO2_12_FULL_64_10]|uniref:Uncharacterized protein n=1 Tax=Handelsmanbacteria sp. (strain RIFCSPLOWO2_12_FULL_64_10) TaxID=1817868 RepID=A0A1F6C323_HANXR|nr:MAG: hypothetical protein A3F84_24040 [Candidatus Handelsmanbacteria bacterium RIFCSPLOWO2_12_FULL_64_10]
MWATDREADFGPTDDGVKVTVSVCEALGLIVKEVGLTANCAESAPTRAVDETVSAAPPMLETVSVSDLL